MHRWSPLNDRQLVLLTQIGEGVEPVTSDTPELARTARALKERGHIVMPKEKGLWRAEITDAGRFYLQHGHHRDRPEDFFLGLLRVTGEDDTEWNRIRLARSRVITDVVDDVIAAVTTDHSTFDISEPVLPRVRSLIRLLAERALPLHGEIAVSKKRKQPRPLLTVHGRPYEISFKERQKQVRYVPKQEGHRTYD